MFKLYQVVKGKAHLCGYTDNKRSLVAKAISLPSGVGRKTMGDLIANRPTSYVNGHYL